MDRIRDLMDAYELGDIDRRAFLSLVQELNCDYWDAAATAALIDESKE